MSSIARQITLWRQKEIEELFKKSYRLYRGTEFDIRTIRTSCEIGRILIVTPRKTGNAPERNLFRRRVKAIFYQEKLYMKGYNWVIFAKKEGLGLTFQQIKKILLEAARAL